MAAVQAEENGNDFLKSSDLCTRELKRVERLVEPLLRQSVWRDRTPLNTAQEQAGSTTTRGCSREGPKAQREART